MKLKVKGQRRSKVMCGY